jgi:hypothetical protein
LAVRQRAALSPGPQVLVFVQRAEQLVDEAALADARDADQREQLEAAVALDTCQGVQQDRPFPFTADEPGPRGLPDVDAEAGARRDRRPHVDGLRLALRVDAGRLAIRDDRAGRFVRPTIDKHTVRRGGRLEARGRIQHVAGRKGVAALRGGVKPHDCLAGGHRQAHTQLPLLHDPVADGYGRAHGALWVVLVGHRCAEDRHDGIADELLDRAPVGLEIGSQLIVVRGQERLDVLRIERVGARGEPDEVGEDHADDLPFAPDPRRHRRESTMRRSASARRAPERLVRHRCRLRHPIDRLEHERERDAVVDRLPDARQLAADRQRDHDRRVMLRHALVGEDAVDVRPEFIG